MQPEHEPHNRIGICTSVHSAADARVVFREARALSSRFDVRVYHFDAGPERPVLPVEGITFTALPRPRGRLSRMIRASSLVRRAITDGADAIVIHDPELLPGFRMLTSRRGVLSIYDVHEDYPSMIRTKAWLPSWARRGVAAAFDREELRMSGHMDLVLAADEYLMGRLSRSRGGPVLVRNYPPLDLFAPGTPAGERAPGMVYVGGVTDERGASVMLRVLERVREAVPQATLTVIGRAPHGDALERLTGAAGVVIAGETPYPEIAPLLVRARLGLALLQDTPKHRRNVPSKLFDYMACGTPYLASGFENIMDAAEGGGVYVDPADETGIVREAVRILLDDAWASTLGQDGRAAAEERYNFGIEANRLLPRVGMLLRS